jgi:hypothetical protein
MIEKITNHYVDEIKGEKEYQELDPKVRQTYLEVELKDIITNEKQIFTENLNNIHDKFENIFKHKYNPTNINCILDLNMNNNYSFDGLKDIFEYMIIFFYNILMFCSEIDVHFIPENSLLNSEENINIIICKINDKLPTGDKLFKKY